MKRKLELKDICGYLPYGLHVFYFEIREKLYRIHGIEFNEMLYHCTPDEYDWWNISTSTPVLRPLSDLYKTITHNGKEIVPIVELAKVSFPKFSWGTNPYKLGAFAGAYRFDFYENIKSFDCSCNGRQEGVDYQVQLFDYLHELKIDCRGLIDSGLAIDANTLDINPYK